ncbi:hypothetical protein FDP41_008502 [Naegleria fowleri]|uniref:Uncharacterized protein n=1 Tax=Naegleria fowleri TaxID=5763 RepID=A0A6A5BGZ1_NAEFO|nr:uncharacterized protein FDP41_008502 [Naegleria fowleri]KAF0973295.1 hypothetical protein FDP41_008502 [Naegleria fowleri]
MNGSTHNCVHNRFYDPDSPSNVFDYSQLAHFVFPKCKESSNPLAMSDSSITAPLEEEEVEWISCEEEMKEDFLRTSIMIEEEDDHPSVLHFLELDFSTTLDENHNNMNRIMENVPEETTLCLDASSSILTTTLPSTTTTTTTTTTIPNSSAVKRMTMNEQDNFSQQRSCSQQRFFETTTPSSEWTCCVSLLITTLLQRTIKQTLLTVSIAILSMLILSIVKEHSKRKDSLERVETNRLLNDEMILVEKQVGIKEITKDVKFTSIMSSLTMAVNVSGIFV